jgi:hypothetical protein
MRSRFTSAHAIALVALFIALGGVAYAAKLAPNSVGSKQIVNSAVRAKDLAKGAVRTGKLRGNAVRAAKVADGTLTGSDVADGSIGTADLAGAAIGARAYGRVAKNGALSRSKNVTKVTHPSTGTYCVSLVPSIDPATTVAVVGPDFGFDDTSLGATAFAHVEWRSDTPTCPTGRIEIRSFLYDGDDTDNNTGGGNLGGDSLNLSDQPFAFVVP